MLQQLAFHKQQTIKATMVQDLDPRPYTDNAHESVLTHEMTAIEPSEIPSRTLTWKPLVYLRHINRRSNDDAHVTLLSMTLLGIICRLVKQSQQLFRFTTGLFINWGRFLVPWDIGSKFITLRLRRARNEVI